MVFRQLPWSQTIHIGQKLRLGNSRITHQADVDVSPDLHPSWVPVHTAHHEEEQCFLHVFMAVDLGSNARAELVVEVFSIERSEFLLGHVLLDAQLILRLAQPGDLVRLQVGVREETRGHGFEAFRLDWEEDATDLNMVTRGGKPS